MLSTDFTRRFGIDHPIIQAGMGNDAGHELAAAVSNAGALGTLGSIGLSPDALAGEIDALKQATNRPWSVNYVAWAWAPFWEQLLDVIVEKGAPVVTVSFGDPLPAVERCKAAGIPVIVQAQDMAGARAALDVGVDAIIVQGNEAGGHTGRRGTLSFAAEALEAARDVPVVVAGGVADGRGLAAALAMGAAGVVMGTRFKATPEYRSMPGALDEIVAASGDDTLYDVVNDMAYDMQWPHAVTGRVVRNAFTAEWDGRRDELARAVQEKGQPFGFLRELVQSGTTVNWAGESSGLVHEVLPAAEVVARTVREAEDLLARVAAMVQQPAATPGR
jgi:nitronate monooxygenase